jgi:hypothetical protein
MAILQKIKESIIEEKYDWKHKRSSSWPKVRKDFLDKNPVCAFCGGKESLEVHHIKPFHLDPSLELDNANLIVLCESKKYGVNCHLFFGHLGNYKKENINIKEDIEFWKEKFKK